MLVFLLLSLRDLSVFAPMWFFLVLSKLDAKKAGKRCALGRFILKKGKKAENFVSFSKFWVFSAIFHHDVPQTMTVRESS